MISFKAPVEKIDQDQTNAPTPMTKYCMVAKGKAID